MYLVVGLGNPEKEYSGTRHNMGFDVINKISEEYNIPVEKSKFKGLYGSGMIESEKVILLKPQTFMNLSGESLREIIDFYKISLEEIIVVYDDVDIDVGNIRIRKSGSAGSHNGMKSIIQHLGTTNFYRIRVGIGNQKENIDMINYVIGKVSKEEYAELEKGILKAKEAVVEIIKNNIDKAMNKYN